MARKPYKKPNRKPPSINQRTIAQAKQAAAARNADAFGQGSHRRKPDVRINKALAAWKARRYDEAIWYYERALARDPHSALLLVDVARAYALRFRYADAEKLVDLAQSLYPDDAHLQQMLGRSYVELQQFDRAIACLRRALELAPSSPDRPQMLLELATMYERLHDLAAARACADEALALAPNFEEARFALATVDRRSGDLAAAEARWRQIIDAPRAAQRVIANCYYELAALHDSLGKYSEAFDELTRAKQIRSRIAFTYRCDADAIAKTSGRNFAAITAYHLERWNAARHELDPLPGGLALLTSHPRSGTTLLEQVLDSHQGVISADELQTMVEMVYAPLAQGATVNESVIKSLDLVGHDQLNERRRAYWSSMEGALREPINGRLLVDKNPELTMALPLVARVFPEMKIVFALRDPRDVVISCFMQRLPLNPVSVHYLSLESTAKKYAKTMSAWLKIRPLLCNPWIEVRYEDMVAELEGQARKVLDFVGQPWDPKVLEYHHRAQRKHVHSPTYEAVTKPVYSSSIGRWRNYAAELEPHMEVLRPFIDAFGYS